MKKLILMPEKKEPLVYLDFALLNGSLRDPEGLEGLASITLSMLLRGTQKSSAQEFHRRLDNLGAEIYTGKYKDSLRIYGVVLSEKLDAFLSLIEEMLLSPAFSEEELKKVKSILHSGLLDELGSDDDIADRRFQEYMLWGNAYGRMTSGSLESIEKISPQDLRDFYQRYFRAQDFIVGASGGFDRTALTKRLKQLFSGLPKESAGRMRVQAPELARGKRVVLLDKPGRSQCQVMVGAPGVSFADKDYFAMLLANHVFGGGSFSARLMKEVREKRGWSYGAYSWFRSGRVPLYFAMQSVPSNKDAVPALKLMLKLLQDFAKKGMTKQEFEFAKKSLLNQSAFLQDTTRKKLDNKVTEAVLELPEGFYDNYRKKLKALTFAKVQSTLKRRLDPSRLFVLVLGTWTGAEKSWESLRSFKNIRLAGFDAAPKDPKDLKRILF